MAEQVNDSLPRRHDHLNAEETLAARWEEAGIHRYDPTRPREETFSVDSPPPTVSGALHIGHVFSYTHQDILVRYQRMRGRNIFYPMGWDDNGLPTERRVQNMLGIRCNPELPYDPDFKPEKGNKTIREVSRRNFIESCAVVTREDEAAFEALWRRLGLSIDWNETYATIDETSRRVSQHSFLDLVKKGQVYSRESPTMWDVDFQTAVAQAEVQDREKSGFMHDIRFGVEGGDGFVISTTRPELLAACIAVVAHPDDERYQAIFGKVAVTPIFGARVPILPADHADPDKGTGILMVCTFGDIMDVEWWKSSALPLKQVIGKDGTLLPVTFGEAPFESTDPERANAAWKDLRGLSVTKARRLLVELLAEDGTAPGGDGPALTAEPLPVKQMVKYYEKGDRPLEFIPTRQWYIRILDHKEALIEQGRKIAWHPDFMRTRYEHWVEGLNQDWCVSRQRFFGVPFPVWYPLGKDRAVDYEHPIFAPQDSLPVDPLTDPPPGYDSAMRNQPGGFAGDPDVMDTWATSSLSPQIASGWPDNLARHEAVYPMDIRPQSHEIIRTWAFYTIVKGWFHDGSIPWRNVVISGWILDPDRKKMSKSKGNVVTPEGLLREHSVDGIRYWAGRARLGADTAFDPNVLKLGKRLVTKIFNMSRFVLMQLDKAPDLELSGAAVTAELDRCLVANLRQVVGDTTAAFDRFEYAVALKASEDAFWSLCDHYLELVKPRCYGDAGRQGQGSALATLQLALSVFLRLFAPFIPYVTEEIWSACPASIANNGASIHVSTWPAEEELAAVPEPEEASALAAATEILGRIRAAKTAARKKLRWPVKALDVEGSATDVAALRGCLDDLLQAGSVSKEGVSLHAGDAPDDARFSVSVTLADE